MSLSNEELAARFNAHMPPTAHLLGQEVLAVDQQAGTSHLKFFAKPAFCNPMGNVQGGFIAAMLDDTAAVACVAKAKAAMVVPTLEFKVSFYAPARQGVLFARGYCHKLGRTVVFAEAELLDEADRLLAKMTTTCVPAAMPENPNFIKRTNP